MENFSLHYQIVIVLYLFFYSGNVFAGESWNDTVHQCCIHTAGFLKPSSELITQLP